MQPSSGMFALISFIVINLLPFSSGIECFYCTSETDLRCLDTRRFNAQYQTDQPSECTQEAVDTTLARTKQHIPSPDAEKGNYECIKIEIISRHVHENKTVIRGCAQGQTRKFDPCTDISHHFTSPGDMIHCSVCRYDSCNSGFSTSSWAILTLLPVIHLFRN